MKVCQITVTGMVQGIGFRPFVAELAEQLNILGWVKNENGIVVIVAKATEEVIAEFEERLQAEAPEGARIDTVTRQELSSEQVVYAYGLEGFRIVESTTRELEGYPLIPADLPTCDQCQRELYDSNNRRYLQPFISCTACGPRYSIIEALPYDRERITMKKFNMCKECDTEYTQKGNRRRHAQTISCHDCGPKLSYRAIANGKALAIGGIQEGPKRTEDLIGAATRCIKNSGIVAIKDIGGFHLACSPFDERAVRELRLLKGREHKPFAVAFPSVEAVKLYCHMDEAEEALLTSDARPIVLLRKREELSVTPFDEMVCKGSPDIGAMLPCNPLQILMLQACGPLIMTSANRSGQLIFTEEDQVKEMFSLYQNEAEHIVSLGILTHDRPILTSLDDSVVRIVRGRKQIFRRGRGYVPEPIPCKLNSHMLAMGGDLKASFCYTGDGRAYPSQYLGDLEDESCFLQYKGQLDRMKDLFGFAPKSVVSDLHPMYLSTAVAESIAKAWNIPCHKVQHHKAHAASVIAEHDLKGDVLCFTFDGTGYGEDGNIWGSEVFTWKDHVMTRVNHLPVITMIGGNEGAKNAATSLYSMLHAYDVRNLDSILSAAAMGQYQIVAKAIDAGINTVKSSSMGRLFDAVSALLQICSYNTYEGMAPIMLENMAAKTNETIALPSDPESWIPALCKELACAEDKGEALVACLARSFIYAVADWILQLAKENGIKQIALSGGSFQNRILVERTIDLLEENGYDVYINEALPAGDGGICLGQAYLIENR